MAFQSLHNKRNFFSDYYLGTVYGRGSGRGRRKQLANKETRKAFERFRRIYDGAEGRCPDHSSFRERFARPLVRDVFSYHLGAGEERIYPLFRSAEEEEAGLTPLLLAYVGEWTVDGGAILRRSPVAQLERAFSERGIRYGFLVTGEAVSLIRKPGEGPRHSCLEFDIQACLDDEDEESFAAAYRLFSSENFVPYEAGVTPIEAVEKESREHAEKVSEDLKAAVFRSAEELARGLVTDWAERAPGGEARDPASLDESELRRFRDASLTCMYRLLFILYAEALDERLEGHELYRKSYSLAGLIEDLMLLRPEEVPSNRYGYWERLLALFEIYDKGLPAIAPYEHIPPRGGDFFSGSTSSGRMIREARLDDRSVAELLLDLTTTVPRAGVGRERVSFRELDIEQLGSVYEGLLEFEPRVARNITIEVRVQGRSFALVPDELVRLCTDKNLQVKGALSIVEGTPAETLHPDAAEDDDLEEEDESEFEITEAEEEQGVVKKGARVLLLRRFEPGDFHFVPGSARKGSGSFYTPRALVDDLVKHALGPLVKGRKAAEIESLRILDPATGSAHFLVGVCRFLGKRLFEAYSRENNGGPPPSFTGSKDEWSREGEAWCKRRVTERCLFGVDLNPTAVNLARVSLWIESLAGDRPLTYFEHHVRCGNSVLGTWLDDFHRPPLPKMGSNHDESLWSSHVKELVRTAAERRELIDTLPGGDIKPESLEEMRYKEDRRREAEELLASARLLFDMRMASAFGLEAIWSDFPQLQGHAESYVNLEEYARSRPWWDEFVRVKERERFFHWELEFPELFLSGTPGFDAVLGNPPWDKVKPDKNEFYGRFDVLIRAYTGGDMDRRVKELHGQYPGLADGYGAYESNKKTTAAILKKSGAFKFQDWQIDGKTTGGDVDIFKSFVEQAWKLVRDGGRVGFVVPSAIYNNEGCTGLRHLILDETQVERFYGFENRRKIFPIHSSYKFVNLVFRKGKPDRDRFEAAFMRHDVGELEDSGKPWAVPVVRSEVEKMSPGTLAFLEYRSPRNREIVLKMYEGKPLLGDRGDGTWNARFYREFDMTNDKDLWTDPKTGKLFMVKQVLGREPSDFAETRALMSDKGFWPLYEGKQIEQFLVDIKPIERWVNLEAAEAKYGRLPDEKSKAVFRDIARNTDERTCIAAVLPEKSCCGNTLPVIQSDALSPESIVTVLNSFPVDFSIRLRIAATHLNFTYMERVAVPGIQKINEHLTPIATMSDFGEGRQHISAYEELWENIWLTNTMVAEAYGLPAEDLMHILESFPVFARKRADFYAYIASRIEDWERY